MQTIRLGKSGVQVSRICLGMMTYGDRAWREWLLDEDEARPFVVRAFEHGINFFDTADMYSLGRSEEITGKLLAEVAPRDEYVLATKVFFPMKDKPNASGLSRKHIMDSVDASLRRLNTEYIDLYQIHRWDYNTPIEETMEALHDVVKAGKARYIGASSMYAWQFAKAQYTAELHGWTKFISMQNHYNLLYREEEREMIPQCLDMGVGLIPWSPLARGTLTRPRLSNTTLRSQTDQHRNGYEESVNWRVEDRVEEVATQRGVPQSQVALAWLLHKAGVVAPIIGASKLHQLDELAQATNLSLSVQELTLLEQDYQPQAINGHD